MFQIGGIVGHNLFSCSVMAYPSALRTISFHWTRLRIPPQLHRLHRLARHIYVHVPTSWSYPQKPPSGLPPAKDPTPPSREQLLTPTKPEHLHNPIHHLLRKSIWSDSRLFSVESCKTDRRTKTGCSIAKTDVSTPQPQLKLGDSKLGHNWYVSPKIPIFRVAGGVQYTIF